MTTEFPLDLKYGLGMVWVLSWSLNLDGYIIPQGVNVIYEFSFVLIKFRPNKINQPVFSSALGSHAKCLPYSVSSGLGESYCWIRSLECLLACFKLVL